MTNSSEPIIHCTIDDTGQLSIYRDTLCLMRVRPKDFILQEVGWVRVRRFIAWNSFHERNVRSQRVASLQPNGPGEWTLCDTRGRSLARLTMVANSNHALSLSIFARPPFNRVGFAWTGPSQEFLCGFGEYSDGPVRSGKWSTWTEEGPVGLGRWSRWLRWTHHVPIPKGYNSTYAPSPSWLSSAGYGAWLEQSERVDWRVHGRLRRVRVWSGALEMRMVVGKDMIETITRRGEWLGYPPLPPPWVFGPWNDAVQGENNVYALAARLRQEEIPSTAIWIEDWTGSWQDQRRFWMRPLSHVVSEELYPHLDTLTHDLHSQGYKVLGYFCPEIAQDTSLYLEAVSGHHLVLGQDGQPVTINILGHLHGELDLTRLATRQWVKDRMFEPMRQLGFDGWMADFGEYLPPTSQLSDGSSGWTSHNRYPELWQSLHREFWDAHRPDGDYTFFVRSASLHTPTIAPIMWGGDSDTDFDRADGLATVIPQALSAGLTGNAFWGTDIAGYMTFGLTQPSTKELYIRWTELAALLPVMRTHHGTARPRNWDLFSDEETTLLYRRYARLHMLLLPYFQTLAHIAHTTGLPLVRPLFLHYPEDSYMSEREQFLLGEALLVAPVVHPGTQCRRVQFPEGQWLNWWTGERIQGPTSRVVEAPLGTLPLFLRSDHPLPLAEGHCAHPLGYLTTANAVDPNEPTLTVILPGPNSQSRTVHLPEGDLTFTPCDEPSSLIGVPLTIPSTLEHAPFLSRPGTLYKLPPYEEVVTHQHKWRWNGALPLFLRLRMFD